MFESSEWVYMFEQSSLGKIAIANIPAGFSVIAWCALIGVAFSGKLLTKKSLDKNGVKP
ncbi:MAG: hypothetical protein LAT66_03950 [Alkalimonas sp.]|nr:hypothetical protein [Alkalimonas sp.]